MTGYVKEKVDVVLVHVRAEEKLIKGMKLRPAEHLGLGYIASSLREKGYSVKIIDGYLEGLTCDETTEAINNVVHRMLGISASHHAFEELRFILDHLKCTTCKHVFLGGPFPTLAYQELLASIEGVDSICLGEGESTSVELVEKVLNGQEWQNVAGIAFRRDGQIIRTSPRALIQDIDTIPFPARDTLPTVLANGGAPHLLTSRGCYGNCTFCSLPELSSYNIGPRRRIRSAKNLIDEIEYIVRKWNPREIFFVDDYFVYESDRARAIEIAEGIIQRGLKVNFSFSCGPNDVDKELFLILKKAGLSAVYLGIESGIQEGLDRMNKKTTVEQNKKAIKILNQLQIKIVIGFIMFEPESSLDDIKRNVAFLEEMGLYALESLHSRLRAYVGTEAAYRISSKNLSKSDCLLDDYFGYTISDSRCEILYNYAAIMYDQLSPYIEMLESLREQIEGVDNLHNIFVETYVTDFKVRLHSFQLFKDLIHSIKKKESIRQIDRMMKDGVEEAVDELRRFCEGVSEILQNHKLKGMPIPSSK